ncbi:hypothetical protein J3R82DRAFT_1134 [Butyriboletus roseoflavus]|nr:hypothetical protein J3R82DRAFT_1134 [Butyriboletus roseoflavus]
MDIDDNSPGPFGGRMSSDYHPRPHQIVGTVQTPTHGVPSRPSPSCERLSVSDGFPQLMIPPSPSSPMNHPREMGDTCQSYGLVRRRSDILLGLGPSAREVTPRKRKHSHGSPHTHVLGHNHTEDDDASTDGANSQSHRRIRPCLWTHQDREFSPLLLMSPGMDRDPPVKEETMSAFHHTQNVSDPSSSIQRRFYAVNSREHDPCTPQRSPSPSVNDPEDRKERGHSDSANSFAEVALASTVPRKHGRLSSLQDFGLPRPFEEIEQPFVGTVKVHERGCEVGPLFLSTNSGRAGGLSSSRKPAGSPTDDPIGEYGIHACSSRSAMLPLEPSSTTYFDKPMCDSPDPIDPTDEDGLTHTELPTVQVTRARFNPTSRG